MISILKFVAVVFASGIAVLGSSIEDAVEKRALLPALLGNVDLVVSACPDVAIGGGGGQACAQRDSSVAALPTDHTPPYNHVQPPLSSPPAPVLPAPTSAAPAPPTHSSPAPAIPAPSTPSPSSVAYRAHP
ncbi:hypothetical protein H4S08_000591 [Coemansia sp. RSA 1365]|nr:hypothetical protein H4S08_000591 [Coemansia sp. RSA 1365]